MCKRRHVRDKAQRCYKLLGRLQMLFPELEMDEAMVRRRMVDAVEGRPFDLRDRLYVLWHDDQYYLVRQRHALRALGLGLGRFVGSRIVSRSLRAFFHDIALGNPNSTFPEDLREKIRNNVHARREPRRPQRHPAMARQKYAVSW